MKKSIFKKLLAIAIVVSMPGHTYAQVPDGEIPDRVMRYFEQNILTLDPIEGVYDMQSWTQGYNAFRVFPKKYENFRTYIKKTGHNTYSIWEAGHQCFARIGETNAYNLTIKWTAANPTIMRIYLENGVRLNYEYEIPDAQMRSDMGRDYIPGGGVIFGNSLIKSYPTKSMYDAAYEKEIKRQAEIAAREAAEAAEEASKAAGWTGSGFALKDGYIVTNYHVVEDAKSIKISGINGDFSSSYSASVVATDKINDLAIIKVNDSKFNGFGLLPYTIDIKQAEVGDDVFVLGYPFIAVH